MTQAKPRFATFEEYLSFSNENEAEGRFQLIDGELTELPPESRLNSTIAFRLALLLVNLGIAIELVHPGKCEVQVPVLQPKDAANRFPDLVVLREEHLQLTERQLTITLDMPPPLLAVEVVSPGKTSRDRDYIRKRAQYAAIGIAEYWIVDPKTQTILVLQLTEAGYRETGQFQGGDRLTSPLFPELVLTAEQIFQIEA